jgi:hypothetical protein
MNLFCLLSSFSARQQRSSASHGNSVYSPAIYQEVGASNWGESSSANFVVTIGTTLQRYCASFIIPPRDGRSIDLTTYRHLMETISTTQIRENDSVTQVGEERHYWNWVSTSCDRAPLIHSAYKWLTSFLCPQVTSVQPLDGFSANLMLSGITKMYQLTL